jgi:hypothetical protein
MGMGLYPKRGKLSQFKPRGGAGRSAFQHFDQFSFDLLQPPLVGGVHFNHHFGQSRSGFDGRDSRAGVLPDFQVNHLFDQFDHAFRSHKNSFLFPLLAKGMPTASGKMPR